MKVTSAAFHEFSAFKDAKLEVCSGINVFLGPNGSGKSHAMKALYALVKTMEPTSSTYTLDERMREKLAKVFRPDNDFVGRLIRWRPDGNHGSILIEGTSLIEEKSGDIGANIVILPKGDVEFNVTSSSWEAEESTLFLPTREVLAMYEGFVAAYQNRELSFDETYYDVCVALGRAALRGPRSEQARELAKPLEEALGGQVVLKGNRFYLKRPDGEMEAHLLAEGYRKLAALVQLIMNGSLTANGILFWDEPEANLNPRLVSVVVDVLLALAKRGVQVFVTTHDYLLSHKLSLVSEYRTHPDVPIRFFAFHRPSEHDPVEVSSGDTLADLPDNPILDEFAKHYDFQRELFIGSAKKTSHK
jgi:ABC-type hemin transport system ATPase subunit